MKKIKDDPIVNKLLKKLKKEKAAPDGYYKEPDGTVRKINVKQKIFNYYMLIVLCLGLVFTSCSKEELEPMCPYTGNIQPTELPCVNQVYNYDWEAILLDSDITWPNNTCLPLLPLPNTSYDYVYEVLVGYLPDPTGGISMLTDNGLFWIFTDKPVQSSQEYLVFDASDLIVKQ